MIGDGALPGAGRERSVNRSKRWESKADPAIERPTDAIVKIDTTTICGTDLHILKGDVPAVTHGRTLGHEAVGTVVAVGAAVESVHRGDKVLVSCISSWLAGSVGRLVLGRAPAALAQELTSAAGTALLLVQVEPYPPTWPPRAMPDFEGPNAAGTQAGAYEARFGARGRDSRRPGSPVDHLTHLVDKAPLVLVIMTTRGQDGLQRMLRSGAPMRLIPPAATPAPSSEVT